MIQDTEPKEIHCPYCGEEITVLLDPYEVGSQYIEDCQVCCQPIEMEVYIEDGQLNVIARHQDDGH